MKLELKSGFTYKCKKQSEAVPLFSGSKHPLSAKCVEIAINVASILAHRLLM